MLTLDFDGILYIRAIVKTFSMGSPRKLLGYLPLNFVSESYILPVLKKSLLEYLQMLYTRLFQSIIVLIPFPWPCHEESYSSPSVLCVE